MPIDYRFEDLDLREEAPQSSDFDDNAISANCSRTICDSVRICCT